MDEVFYELFSNLPRQGPGDVDTSLSILRSIKSKREVTTLADIGCGTGVVTLEFAKHTDGVVVGVDNYKPYLDELAQNAKAIGIPDGVRCVVGDMNSLPFSDGEFDVIWSEGSIYQMGIDEGLKAWKRFLKPNGYMVFSDSCWLRANPSRELVDFWLAEYPTMMDVDQVSSLIAKNGYLLEDTVPLPAKAWTEDYYDYLQVNVNRLRDKYSDNPEALSIVDATQHEIDVFHKYNSYYGYLFFVARK